MSWCLPQGSEKVIYEKTGSRDGNHKQVDGEKTIEKEEEELIKQKPELIQKK